MGRSRIALPYYGWSSHGFLSHSIVILGQDLVSKDVLIKSADI